MQVAVQQHLPNTWDVPWFVAILTIGTDTNFSLSKTIDDEEEQRQRQSGRDATCY